MASSSEGNYTPELTLDGDQEDESRWSGGGDAFGDFVAKELLPSFHDRLHRLVHRPDEIVPQIRNDAAERVGNAWPRRHQHFRQAEFARQSRRMQRSGAAEGEQREIARIMAA